MAPVSLKIIVILFLDFSQLVCCQATGRNTIGVSHNVTVFKSPPLITKQSSTKDIWFVINEWRNSKDVEDTFVVIPCEADAQPKPIYRWQKDGKEFIWKDRENKIFQRNGVGTLVFVSPQLEDIGEYQCFASNQWGTAMTSHVFLKQTELNSFIDDKIANVVAGEGEPFKLSCMPPDGLPRPKVSWLQEWSDGHLETINSSSITVDPEGSLWFSSIRCDDRSNFFTYTCSAQSTLTRMFKLGNRVSLEVIPRNCRSKTKPQLLYTSKRNSVAIRNGTASLWCIIGGKPLPEIKWAKRNGLLPSDRIEYSNWGKTLTIKNVSFSDEGAYECSWGSDKSDNTNFSSYNMYLRVYAAPYFTKEPEIVLAEEGETVEIQCEAGGKPTPIITWIQNGRLLQNFSKDSRKHVATGGLIIVNVTKYDTSNYGCNATNSFGYVYKDVFVNVISDDGDDDSDSDAAELPEFIDDQALLYTRIALSIVLLVALVIIAIGLVLWRRHFRKTYVSRNEMDKFLNGDVTVMDNDSAYKYPYDKERYEVSSNSFRVDEKASLGSGEYGWVCKGKVHVGSDDITVAVKMANPQKFHKTTIIGLLSEIKVLAYVGKHANITELIGANTSEMQLGKVLIFLELCELGSLEKYLRGLRSTEESSEVVSSEPFYYAELDTETTTCTNVVEMKTMLPSVLDPSVFEDLYRWSVEICNGMAFLASKHVVHADLATRNVLLNGNKEAKICDFGLSRRMYNYASYVKEHQEPLPWKWMAPESLRVQEFNEKTDVWAFGVTLWEIYSLGDTPYQGLSWDQNFGMMLQNGFRLSKPQFNEKNMYSVMCECWNVNPLCRPSFTDIKTKLNS